LEIFSKAAVLLKKILESCVILSFEHLPYSKDLPLRPQVGSTAMEQNQQQTPGNHQDLYLMTGAQFEEQTDLQISDEILQQFNAAQEQDLDLDLDSDFDYDSLMAQNGSPVGLDGLFPTSASTPPFRHGEDPLSFLDGEAHTPIVPAQDTAEANDSVPLDEADIIDNESMANAAEDKSPAKRRKTGGARTGPAQNHKYDQEAYGKAYLNLMFAGAVVTDYLPGSKRKRGGLEVQLGPTTARVPPMQPPDRPHPEADTSSPRRKKVPRSRQTMTDKPSQKLAEKRVYGVFPESATTLATARSSCYGTQIYRWQPTDQTVPTTDAEKRACAQRLYNAIVDMTVVRGPLGRSRQGHRLILSMDYSEKYIAWRCFEIVQRALDLHLYGCMTPKYADRGYNVTTGKQLFDTHHRGSVKNPASYRDLTFNQRMDDMVQDLTINKILCQEVLDGMVDLNYALVLAPGRAVEVKVQNGNNNGDRDRRTVAQRQELAALKAQTPMLQRQLSATRQPGAVPAAPMMTDMPDTTGLASSPTANRPALASNPSAANIAPRRGKAPKKPQTPKPTGRKQDIDKPGTKTPAPRKVAQRYTLLEQPTQMVSPYVAPENNGAIPESENAFPTVTRDDQAHRIIAKTAGMQQQEQTNYDAEYDYDEPQAGGSTNKYNMEPASFGPIEMISSSTNRITPGTEGIQDGQGELENENGYGEYGGDWANGNYGINDRKFEPSVSTISPEQWPGFAPLSSSDSEADEYGRGMYNGSWPAGNHSLN
jgi:hypothetical protein